MFNVRFPGFYSFAWSSSYAGKALSYALRLKALGLTLATALLTPCPSCTGSKLKIEGDLVRKGAAPPAKALHVSWKMPLLL